MDPVKTKVVVIGSGPGGYTAAFRAADLGNDVVLIERFKTLGGVCLNVGCIPSKALLHTAKVLDEAKDMSAHGVTFSNPTIDIEKVLKSKNAVISRLTGGLALLAKQRKVSVIQGVATFINAHQLEVVHDNQVTRVDFEYAIIAVGSEAIRLPFLPTDPRIFTSTGALELRDVKGDLLVLGGGIIGLEMATVYAALGANVTVVEFLDRLIPSADADLVAVLQKRMEKKGVKFLLKTKLVGVEPKDDGLYVTLEGEHATKQPLCFQQLLVAVGRKPSGGAIGAAKAGVVVDEKGFIPVDRQMRTNISHIFAIGDVVGQPMLAHKAIPEGKIAAEVISGLKHYFEPMCIPNVAYTDPEIAWVGLTEQDAKAKGVPHEKMVFPWVASGRALSMNRSEGLTKLIVEPKTHRVLGAGIVGVNAGDLISEAVLAIEMGCDVSDIALTIHPHPTLSETILQAAEMIEGSITDLYLPKDNKSKS